MKTVLSQDIPEQIAMLDKPITFNGVQITAVTHRLKEGVLLHRLSISGLLTRELADELGCQDLVFLENGSPKQGFSKFDLDVECGAFRATFEADPDLKQRFELTGDCCEGFVVKRTESGLFQLSWRMNYHGDPHPALVYLEAVGAGDSALRIVPLNSDSCSRRPARTVRKTMTPAPVLGEPSVANEHA